MAYVLESLKENAGILDRYKNLKKLSIFLEQLFKKENQLSADAEEMLI